jgi:DNA-binding NtrC family response regulator
LAAVQIFRKMAKILLVDDDPQHASVRKAILERQHMDVRWVGDTAEALALLEQPEFAREVNLVISSEQHSGIVLTGFISELHLRMPELPILVLGEKSAIHGEFSGFPVEFVKRPVTADDLLNGVSRVLKTWGQTQLKTA